jgi:nucleotide-binding universal stress UspA family protein
VLALPRALAGEAVERLDEQTRAGAERTAQEGAALARDCGLAAKPAAVRGRGAPWAALCERAEADQAQALVLGTHGHGRLASALLGSVARGVVHHSRAPVLVVPERHGSP